MNVYSVTRSTCKQKAFTNQYNKFWGLVQNYCKYLIYIQVAPLRKRSKVTVEHLQRTTNVVHQVSSRFLQEDIQDFPT